MVPTRVRLLEDTPGTVYASPWNSGCTHMFGSVGPRRHAHRPFLECSLLANRSLWPFAMMAPRPIGFADWLLDQSGSRFDFVPSPLDFILLRDDPAQIWGYWFYLTGHTHCLCILAWKKVLNSSYTTPRAYWTSL